MQGEPARAQAAAAQAAPAAAPHEAPPASQQATPAPQPPSLGGTLRGLTSDLGTAFHDRLQLLSFEVRKAGRALTEMVMLAVLVALLVSAAWFSLMVAVFMGGTALGLHWSLALLIVFLSNLGAAAALWWRVVHLTTALTLPATARTLRARVPPPPVPDPGVGATPQMQGADHG